MICTMHLGVDGIRIRERSIPRSTCPGYVIPAHILGLAVVGTVLLVMGSGFSTYLIDLPRAH